MSINKIVTTCALMLILLTSLFLIFKDTSAGSKITSSLTKEKINSNPTLKKSDVSVADYPFRLGEKLKYGIYAAGLKVGEAIITFWGDVKINDITTKLVVLEAKGPGFSDIEKVYGDIDSFTPIRVERKIRLFGEDIFILEEYDHSKNDVIITRKAKKTTIEKISSKEKLGNVILLLYYFRYKKDKYKIGDRISFNLPTKELEMLVDKQTDIRVPAGDFSAILLRSIPSHFTVWFNKDTNSVPLRIQGVIGFGNTYLSLTDMETRK